MGHEGTVHEGGTVMTNLTISLTLKDLLEAVPLVVKSTGDARLIFRAVKQALRDVNVSLKASSSFKVGDRVTSQDRHGRVLTGMIDQIAKVTAVITTIDGLRWRCRLSSLTKSV